MSRLKGIASLFATVQRRRPVGRRQRPSWLSRAERLESRTLLTVTPTLIAPGVLEIVYDPIAAQSCIVEIEQAGSHNIPAVDFTADINVYAPSNAATTPSSWFFPNISQIIVTVRNYDGIGVNNNSLTIKGINGPSDRIIIGGGGRTAAGRWSSETAGGWQCLLSVEGIDDLTVTAGGTINVSGSFTNDTEDASIRAIGQVVERAAEQHTATVTIGETTPAVGVQPRPWLFSNTIEIVGAELDIYSTITATDRIDLRAGDSAPDTGRSNLVLPYDITVLGNATTGEGVLSLFSTKNITQLQTSTILAPTLVAISSVPRAATTDGPWMIDLGSANNDFDEISLGMTAAPGDATVAATEGRIGIRDVDDLAVVDFGILASTGRVRIDTAGPLSITAPIQATGLILESDDSVVSFPGAIMRLGDLGITVLANATFAPTSTGDVTLAGPITILDDTPAALVANKIIAAGRVTLSGGFYCPHAGTTTFAGGTGVLLSGAVQVGSTKLDANSKVIEIFDHDLNLISATGGIDVGRVPGNDATPFAVQATNIIALDAPDSITIAGSIFAGTIYGDPSDLTETQALPAITIRGLADVNITATGSLRTQSYETNPDATTNPLVGKISITDATQLNVDGKITADGAVDIAILGDVYLYGPTTARENVVVLTTAGGIDVQGAVVSTGGTYTAAPAAGSQREPNVILSAPIGGISTSGLGTLTAGTVTAGGVTTFGGIRLTAQQDIVIGADIDTPGPVTATSKLGLFDLSALLQAGNKSPVAITAANGIVESDLDFGRIVAETVTLLNTGAAGGPSDIDLQGRLNQMGLVTATNLAVGGAVRIANSGLLNVGGITAQRDAVTPSLVVLSATSGITQTGPILANLLAVRNTSPTAVTLTSILNDVDQFAAANATGTVTYTDADDFEIGVNRTGPLGIEIAGDAVALSSVAPFSVVRVVSGLSYRTLSIAAGTSSGTTVGTVEFVTTSELDNLNGGPFGGTLRDMMRYSRTNGARYTVGGSLRPQPMALVFDEAGYPVQEITVAANLPVLTLPINVLGSRLEASVVAAGVSRVGIRGTSSVARGLTFGRSSDGNLIESTALYGFSMGSSMFVVSGRNTFQNLLVGMDDAGTPNPNRIGLLLSSPTATGNLVGGEVEAEIDPDTGVGNHFVANRAAGIFIDNGASGNRIGGNVIGDASGFLPALANGDGVRIRGGTGNMIGLPGTAGTPISVSNLIAGNLSSGVLVLNANSGTLARANKIQNNLIERSGGVSRSNTGAGAGVLVHGSTFVDIGGNGTALGNTIYDQGAGGVAAVDGVRIVNSGNVRVIGNDVGVFVDPESGVEAVRSNSGHGISVARSSAVQVSGRNIIGGNFGDGVAISDASSGVSVTGNLIGLFSNGLEAGNFGDGVSIRAAIGNTVGAGNQIAFNRDGVSINDAVAATLAAGNTVTGSEIFRNLATGVRVVGGSRSLIGGLATATGNVIGENDGDGVRIEWSSVTGAPTGHVVQGNAIGTDNNGGFVNRGNVGSGIVISGGTGNVVSNGNRVMNNLQSGVDLFGGSANLVGGAGVVGNVVENNLDDGVRVLAVGTTGWVRFVRVESGGSNYSADTFVTLGAPPSTPGGVTARAVPVIRSVRGVPGVIVGFFVDDPGLGYTPNASVSVEITDPNDSGSGAAATATATLASTTLTSARDHVVQGNAIRLNGSNGVAAVGSTVLGLTVGQRVTSTGVSGVGNVIEDNIGYGVVVAEGAQRVSAQGNSLFGNLLGGIQMGPQANRSTAQTLSLTSAEIRQPSGGGQQIVVRGTLSNPIYASQQYSVDIYASQPEDGNYPALTGYQARRYLGRATVTAGANGVARLAITITARIEVGEVITATATALRFEAGSTSMISNGVTADYPGMPTPRF